VAGIYIHIPFCRQKCYYCDFYKTINNSRTADFLKALIQEAEVRKDYVGGETIKTIYFGGGTPSVLTEKELTAFLEGLYRLFPVAQDAEVTFESNPDDLTPDYLHSLRRAGINRLSIVTQSFNNTLIKKMNRRHDASQAVAAIENAGNAGFSNLSADLIYGLPGLTGEQWAADLKQMFSLPVSHLSAYHLTYHQGTPFYTWLKKGTLKELPEADSVEQFYMLLEEAEKAGFMQYEISNFARNEMYSQHNTAYWFGEKYLGLGPSAHSFNGSSRRWNVAHLEAYINGIDRNTSYFEEEQLSLTDQFNEYILTRIRTRWGIDEADIEERFGSEAVSYVHCTAEKHISTGNILREQNRLFLSRKGLLMSDSVMTDFIKV